MYVKNCSSLMFLVNFVQFSQIYYHGFVGLGILVIAVYRLTFSNSQSLHNFYNITIKNIVWFGYHLSLYRDCNLHCANVNWRAQNCSPFGNHKRFNFSYWKLPINWIFSPDTEKELGIFSLDFSLEHWLLEWLYVTGWEWLYVIL